MTRPITIESHIHFERRGRGRRKSVRSGTAPTPTSREPGRVPRVARLMALAIRFDELIQAGEVTDYAELARLAHVTRARITQIMNLRMLAPDIQEAILFAAASGGWPRHDLPAAAAADCPGGRLAETAAVVEGTATSPMSIVVPTPWS